MTGEILWTGVSAALGIVLIRRYAHALLLVDEPNHRSTHEEPVPRGAGIAFSVAAMLTLFFFHREIWDGYFIVPGSLLLILMVGILDDRHEAAPKMKFLAIAMATFILWDGGLLIDRVGEYFGMEIRFGWLALPFTFFAVAGFTNALNLIDGIDGLAGTISLVILGAFFSLGWRHGDAFLLSLTLTFGTGVLVFLFFNWNPASIFMGDSGSLTLGFLISVLSIYALKYLPSVSVLYLGAIPLIDTLVVMIRRKRDGRSATAPDRCHLHHLIHRRKGSVPKTVLTLGGFQLIFAVIGLMLPRGIDQTIPLLVFLLIVIAVYRYVGKIIAESGNGCY